MPRQPAIRPGSRENPLAQFPAEDRDQIANALVHGLPARTGARNFSLVPGDESRPPEPKLVSRSAGRARYPGVASGTRIYSRETELPPELKARQRKLKEAQRQELYRSVGAILGQEGNKGVTAQNFGIGQTGPGAGLGGLGTTSGGTFTLAGGGGGGVGVGGLGGLGGGGSRGGTSFFDAIGRIFGF